MGLGDIFKAGQYKNEIEALKQEKYNPNKNKK